MKALHTNLIKIALFLGLFVTLQSCVLKPGTWKNDRIASGKLDDFHNLNKEILKFLKADDTKGIKILCSKEFNADNHERQIELVSNRLTDNDYSILDEYYVVHQFKDTDSVIAKSGDIKRYNIYYPYKATEMYMAYLIPKKSNNKYMISLVYGKLTYGWKLVDLNLAPYTINGKTAPELYAIARDQYNKKQIQAALNNVSLAVACIEPGAYWQYPDKIDAARFYVRVNQEVNYKYSYPLVLKQLATGPMLLRVYTKNLDDGTYPMIYYMTHFPLKDTNEVKKENMQIRNVLKKLMPGLEQNNKYILYSAFNKQPTGYESVDHFDMTDKLY